MKRFLPLMLLALLAVSCTGDPPPSEPAASPPASASASPASSTSPRPPTTSRGGTDCRSVVEGMSMRQRLAQLVVIGVDPSDPAGAVRLVRDEQVGGIFIGGNATDLLVGDALARVQRAAEVPVAVAVDDEGGRVQRVERLDGDLPSARDMARTMTPQQVRDLAAERGRALAARGVTVNYAPVVDLTDEAAGAAIGDRSFSADPEVARDYAQAFANGLEQAGVQPVIKHFPGHGRATGDSHTGLVRTPPLPELRGYDLLPYERIGEYGSDTGVMVGHLDVPGLTGGEPASLSPAAYRLLRGDYRFRGPVVTDDLGAMRAVTDRYDLPEAVMRALRSGADQALWSSGGGVDAVLDRLEQAVADGDLPRARVRQALNRVLPNKGAC